MRGFIKAAVSLVICSSAALTGCMSEDVEDATADAEEALVQQKGTAGVGAPQGAWAPTQGSEAPVLPPVAELPTEGIPAQPYAGGCAPIPGFAAPSHQAPSFPAPSYPAPNFGAPSYTAPTYMAPNYGAPSYQAPSQAPNVQAPVYAAPSYAGPSFAAPIYEAPTYQAPSFPAPIYMMPVYEAPHQMLPANPNVGGCYGGFAGQGQLSPIQQAPMGKSTH